MPVNYKKPIEIRDGRNGGWFWIDKEVWSDKRLSSSDKVVYGTLAYFANNKNQLAFPSITHLEGYSNISNRQIHISIKKLEKYKYLLVIRRYGKPNQYTLIDEAIREQKLTTANSAPLQPLHTTPATIAPPTRGQLVQNNTTNNNINNTYITTLTDDEENSSYKKDIKRIIKWAYVEALIHPSIPENIFSKEVEKAIGRVGWEKVRKLFEYENNAVAFYMNIKNI